MFFFIQPGTHVEETHFGIPGGNVRRSVKRGSIVLRPVEGNQNVTPLASWFASRLQNLDGWKRPACEVVKSGKA